jgi:hypothetical protein
MNEVEGRRFLAALRAEAAEVDRQRDHLEDRATDLRKAIEGLAALYSDEQADDVLPARAQSAVRRAVEERMNLRDRIIAVLYDNPRRWMTSEQLAKHEAVQALNLTDAQAAVRAAIRRMNGDVKMKHLDGRTKGFKLTPPVREKVDQRLEEAR